MPSIAPAPLSPILNSKKRRREDVSSSTTSAYSDATAMSFEMQFEKGLAASPRLSRHDPSVDKIRSEFSQQRSYLPSRSRPKRQRPSGSFDAWKAIEEMENGVGHAHDEDQRSERGVKLLKADLRPCHICFRKPSERRELDEYGDCEGCGRRTCYICIRQCEGLGMAWERRTLFGGENHGDERHDVLENEEDVSEPTGWGVEAGRAHKGKVCSRCCVEKGEEGEVWCLGCLRAEEGD